MTRPQLLAARALPSERVAPLFDRVVFGIDFGTASLAAARWAMANVTREAHAILVHVVPQPRSRPTPVSAASTGSSDDAPHRLVPTVTGGLGGFGATLRAATIRSLVRIGRPSDWLSTITNGVEASLVVLGRRADSRRLRKGEPNVLERVARRSSTSVLVVPEGASEPPRHIVAAVDESAFSRPILRIARWLARLHRCPLTVVHVVSPVEGAYDRVIRGQGNARIRTPVRVDNRILEEESANVEYPTMESARIEVAVGDPAREVIALASTLDSPLVVVGRRGADHAPPGSLGSVVRELLARAPMPLIAASGGAAL